MRLFHLFSFFFQAEDGIRDGHVTGVQTCALPISLIVTSPPFLTYIGALAVGLERFQTSRALGVTAALSGTAFLAAQHLSAPEGKPFLLALVLIGPVLLIAGNLYCAIRCAGVSSHTRVIP